MSPGKASGQGAGHGRILRVKQPSLKMTYCAKHQSTETNLRCGRCETPVCPRCMVHSPVGVRCPECAQQRRLPTFEVTATFLGRAILAGLVLGVAGGVAIRVILAMLGGLPFVGVIAVVGAGYLIGEGISAAVNRKRGRNLKFVAAGSVLIALIVVLAGVSLNPFVLLTGAAAIYVAVGRL